MQSSKSRRDKRTHSKKDNKLSKLIKQDCDSEGAESEHELSYYLNDRVKLMKEVLKIIKPKKIRVMAPDCMQSLDNEEINSMLLDELLGISNKRLKYIFNGQNLNEESSSTDPEEEQSVDVISLDDISNDEFVIDLDSDKEESRRKHHKKHKTVIKEEPRRKKVKKEKADKKTPENAQDSSKNQMSEQNLMSVLELLELQARARAIRSQLALESNKKAEEAAKVSAEVESSDNEDAVIVESPENEEIVITSSDSENENSQSVQQEQNHVFRRSTDDGPESNSVEDEETRQGSDDPSVEKGKFTGESNIVSDQTEKNTAISEQISGNTGKDESTNGKQVLGVVDIPLPKESTTSGGSPITNESFQTNREAKDNSFKEANNSKNDNSEASTSKMNENLREVNVPTASASRGKDMAAKNSTDTDSKRSVDKKDKEKKDKSSRVCRRKLSKLAKKKAAGTESIEKMSAKSSNENDDNRDKISCSNVQERDSKIDESEGIILNVDQAEMDCINLD